MKVGDILITAIPQADGKRKNRPVLLLRKMPPYDDLLVCGISTQIKNKVENFDIIIDEKHPDYKDSGLLEASLIRLGYIAVLPENKIKGTIGKISSDTYNKLVKTLGNFISAGTI